MARPYSVDLREQVMTAIRAGVLCHAAAERFGVSASTAICWRQRESRTGSVAPGQMGGHKPRRLIGDHRVWLVERCSKGDFTLRGLVAELAGRGLTVDYRSVWTFVHDEKLSFKKNPRRRRAGPPGRGPASDAMERPSAVD